jgi:Helicase conserved C-terminal domain
MNDKQAVQRMVKLMHAYGGSQKVPIKCICYCLTTKKCESIARLFQEQYKQEKSLASSAFYHADMTPEAKRKVLKEFCSNKTLQVICATSALGRGVHFEFPIQFIFHRNMPLSLTGMHIAQMKESRQSWTNNKVSLQIISKRLVEVVEMVKSAIVSCFTHLEIQSTPSM